VGFSGKLPVTGWILPPIPQKYCILLSNTAALFTNIFMILDDFFVEMEKRGES
jgi:hypothetical protein